MINQNKKQINDCDTQCGTCIQEPYICLTCNERRVQPPLCECDETKYIKDSNNVCQPKVCPYNCLTCDSNNQCKQCKGNRIQPPLCICAEGFYEDPNKQSEFCLKCDQGFYFDKTYKNCMKCHQLCFSCYGQESSNCLYCSFNLKLNKKNECVCPVNQQLIQEDQINYSCYSFMKFQVNPFYGQQSYQFSIGPHFLDTDMQMQIHNILPQNQNINNLMNKFQVIFYIINSLQPTAMFLLLNMQIPPNLYQYLAQFGKLVFMRVPATQEEIVTKDFKLFDFNFDDYTQESPKYQLSRLGFSNLILINCQYVLIKYAIINNKSGDGAFIYQYQFRELQEYF
ncbi:hypothetical protein ABPG72_011507 [Tetrahymena utriculariae]